MGLAIYYSSLLPRPRLKSLKIRAVDASESVALRSHVLERVDEELVKGNERAALSLVKDLQGKPGGLCCFGAARQVPQRLYTLDELKLNGIETSSLLSPVDTTLGSIERNLQFAAVLGGLSAWVVFGLNQLQILILSLGFLFIWSVDLVAFGGGVGSLVLDTIGHTISQKYRNRVTQHEAGHFLIAYLLGVLPRGYTLSSLEALKKEGSLNVQAGTAFVDFEFLEEVNTGKVSAKTLNQFSCIALAGVATEYLLFGYSEGGLADIDKGVPASFEGKTIHCGCTQSPTNHVHRVKHGEGNRNHVCGEQICKLHKSYNGDVADIWMDCLKVWASPKRKLILR